MVQKSVSRSERLGLACVLALAILPGCRARWEKFSNRIIPHPSQAPIAAPVSVETGAANANAELLKEMFSVVLMQEPKDRSLFGNYVDSLNQGASFEGVYNGFSHSSYYRNLETRVKGAQPAALAYFSSEMNLLLLAEKDPKAPDIEATKPLATPLDPSQMQGGVEPVLKFGQTKESTVKPAVPTAAELAKLFKNSSIFTLKRVLADEALLVISEKRQEKGELPRWYGEQVPRWNATGVDFGLKQRSEGDAKFHTEWAKSADPDRLAWEVLNRLHRILNSKNQGAK